MVAQGQQAEAFLGLGDFQLIAEQRSILGGGLRAGQQVGARQARVGIGDWAFLESRWAAMGRL